MSLRECKCPDFSFLTYAHFMVSNWMNNKKIKIKRRYKKETNRIKRENAFFVEPVYFCVRVVSGIDYNNNLVLY